MRQKDNARKISNWYVKYLVNKEFPTFKEYLEWMRIIIPQDEKFIKIFEEYQGNPEAFKRAISFDKYIVRAVEEDEKIRKDKERHEKKYQNEKIQDHKLKQLYLQKDEESKLEVEVLDILVIKKKVE